jgi:hypothetical protein
MRRYKMIAEDIYQKSQLLSKPLALEVLHFIEFLQIKQSTLMADDVDKIDEENIKKIISSTDKSNPFCGMWQERNDMEDVDSYVRKLRQGRQF